METATKKQVKRFLQCRLRYSIRFPGRGEQRKINGVLEEIKDNEGTVERRLPSVELPKKKTRASVTIGPLSDEEIERLEGNPARGQAPDPYFTLLKNQGKVRWLFAKPDEDQSDAEKLEEARRENAALRAKIEDLERKPAAAVPDEGAARTAAAFGFPGTGQQP